MKRLCLSLLLLGFVASPVFAVSATPSASPKTATSSGNVKGIYDDPFATEYSDTMALTSTASATPTPAATPRTVRTTAAKVPVAGSTENTIMLLIGGGVLVVMGLKFSKV